MSTTSLHHVEDASDDAPGNQSPNYTTDVALSEQPVVPAHAPDSHRKKRKRALVTPIPKALSAPAGGASEELHAGSDDSDPSISVLVKRPKITHKKWIVEAHFAPNEDNNEDGEAADTDEDATPTTKNKGKGKAKATSKSKAKPKRGQPTFTDAQIQTFLDGVEQLTDWSSTTVPKKFLRVIECFDKEHMDWKEISLKYEKGADRTTEKDGEKKKLVTYSFLHRKYNDLAPGFYAGKGIAPFIPLVLRLKLAKKKNKESKSEPKKTVSKKVQHNTARDNGAGQVDVSSVRETRETLEYQKEPGFDNEMVTDEDDNGAGKPKNRKIAPLRKPSTKTSRPAPEAAITVRMARPASEDAKLKQLFRQLIPKVRLVVRPRTRDNFQHNVPLQAQLASDVVPQSDIDRYFPNRRSTDTFHFALATGDSVLGCPTRPILDRQSGVKYCQYLRDQDSDVEVLQYPGESHTGVIIRRFVACISPSIRAELPTHDLFENEQDGGSVLKALPTPWTMKELCDLYALAKVMGAEEVCDMVLDRWLEELHRPTPRVTCNEVGEREVFNILDVAPEFISFLSQHNDTSALNYLAEIVAGKGVAGYRMLHTHGLACWSKSWKRDIIRKLEEKELSTVVLNDAQAICKTFHHHRDEEECYKVQALTSASVVAHKMAENPEGVQAAVSEDEYVYWWERNAPARPARQVAAINRKSKRTTGEEDKAADAERIAKRKKFRALKEKEDAMTSIMLHLPSFISDPEDTTDGDDEDEYQNPSSPPAYTRPIVEDRFLYGNKKMDESKKDFGDMADRKLALVKKKLAEWREQGIDVDNVHAPNVDEESDEKSDEE